MFDDEALDDEGSGIDDDCLLVSVLLREVDGGNSVVGNIVADFDVSEAEERLGVDAADDSVEANVPEFVVTVGNWLPSPDDKLDEDDKRFCVVKLNVCALSDVIGFDAAELFAAVGEERDIVVDGGVYVEE